MVKLNGQEWSIYFKNRSRLDSIWCQTNENTGKGLIGPGNLQMIKPENLTHILYLQEEHNVPHNCY